MKNETNRQNLKVQTIYVTVFEPQSGWLRHVRTMAENKIPKKVYEARV